MVEEHVHHATINRMLRQNSGGEFFQLYHLVKWK